jgi:hypothetical protein
MPQQVIHEVATVLSVIKSIHTIWLFFHTRLEINVDITAFPVTRSCVYIYILLKYCEIEMWHFQTRHISNHTSHRLGLN